MRRDKLDRLRARGVDPYPVGFPRTTTIADLRAKHPDLPPDTRTGERVGIAGRVVLFRTGGQAVLRHACAMPAATCRSWSAWSRSASRR